MNKNWESIKKGIIGGFHSISNKTDELTQIGRVKLEIISLKRKIEQVMIELGGRVYEELKNGSSEIISVNEEMSGLAQKLDLLSAQLKNAKKKLANICKENGI